MNRRVMASYRMAQKNETKDGGYRAFFEMWAWFMKTTGLKLSERMTALMRPGSAKSEEDIADVVQAWERGESELLRMDENCRLPEPWRMTALKGLLTAKMRDHVEMRANLSTYERISMTMLWVVLYKRNCMVVVTSRVCCCYILTLCAHCS